jgi:excisionase family DNA binding protein
MSSSSSSYPYESRLPAPKGDATNAAFRAASVPETLLNSEEAAAVMKIHPKTLQKLARRGVVRGIHVGKLWRFRASAIEAWIESQ